MIPSRLRNRNTNPTFNSVRRHLIHNRKTMAPTECRRVKVSACRWRYLWEVRWFTLKLWKYSSISSIADTKKAGAEEDAWKRGLFEVCVRVSYKSRFHPYRLKPFSKQRQVIWFLVKRTREISETRPQILGKISD